MILIECNKEFSMKNNILGSGIMEKQKKAAFYSLLMVISGIFGWIYELIFYYLNGGCKQIYLRGICFGPWIDIYVLGGLLIYLINKNKCNSWFKVFLKSGVICGILEYITGLGIYILFDGKRSWDYNTEILNFGNINGFICLRSVLFFALSGIILMYVIVPNIKKLLNKESKIINYVSIILFILFLFDEIYNMSIKLNIINFPSANSIYESFGLTYW